MLRQPMVRKALVAAALAGLLAAAATVAFADHAWDGNHWRSDNLSPTVVDRTSSPLYDVPAGVAEWADLGTPMTPALTNGNKGDIKVAEGSSVFWLGLARIFVDDTGHITRGEVKVNTRLLEAYGADAADHVLCQELGHVLGLDHNRAELDTCMNDQAPLGSATAPNLHDVEQLDLIYSHADVVDGGDDGGGGGGNCPPGNPNHRNCQTANGRWMTVHVFPIP